MTSPRSAPDHRLSNQASQLAYGHLFNEQAVEVLARCPQIAPTYSPFSQRAPRFTVPQEVGLA